MFKTHHYVHLIVFLDLTDEAQVDADWIVWIGVANSYFLERLDFGVTKLRTKNQKKIKQESFKVNKHSNIFNNLISIY